MLPIAPHHWPKFDAVIDGALFVDSRVSSIYGRNYRSLAENRFTSGYNKVLRCGTRLFVSTNLSYLIYSSSGGGGGGAQIIGASTGHRAIVSIEFGGGGDGDTPISVRFQNQQASPVHPIGGDDDSFATRGNEIVIRRVANARHPTFLVMADIAHVFSTM